MRTNSTEFESFNRNLNKGLRLVLKIDFPTPLYLVSHDDVPNIPVGALPHTIKNVSSTSQRLNPDTGRSEIGAINLDIVDKDGGFSSRLNTEDAAGEGLTGRKVELYRGGEGMDWSDFRLEQTQQISQAVSYKDGGYRVQCADIQRAMRSDIFDIAKTKLAADFDAGATTLNVFETTDFEACTHVASFGDQQSGSFFYLKIKYENGFEIVRATGKTGTSFTGITRGMFGTTDVDHVYEVGTDEDDGIEIEEYVYLELPAPAMAHALLTGSLPGGGTIPTRWNLGISTASVDEDSFENIGEDWFDPSDYSKGLIFRFQGVEKTDGKRFIEREVNLLAGAFMYVRADGKLYYKRMTGVLTSSDYVAELTPDNVVKAGALKHNLAKVRNTFDIEWSWVHFPSEDKPRYARRNVLVDATSQGIHGESKTHTLRFRGLHNERHTYTTLINRFDALRDRFAGPPLTITLDLMPNMNDLEVGDICRVFLPNVKDFVSGGHLDRSMEVQRLTIDQRTGRMRASMFGSSLKAEPIVDNGAGANSELPDSWYSSEGTDFATAGLSIDGSGILQSSGSLAGGTTTRTIFYYLGDFTIPTGTTLTVSGNTQLRVRGQFQINGTLNVSGGKPSASPGFIGTTYGGPPQLEGRNPPTYPDYRGSPYSVQGRYAAMPVLEIENNSGVLEGIPSDMRGSGGGIGGDVMFWNSGDVVWEQHASGGNGGGGGGSTVTVSRGCGYGVSGVTDISGGPGGVGAVSATPATIGLAAGSGGGGAPGCLVHLLDGSGVTFPIIVGNVDGSYGTSPITGGDPNSQGKARASSPVDLGISVARAQYVPKSRDPYPDYTNDGLGPQDGLSTYFATVYQRAASAPATPTTDDGSYNFDTQTLTPPSGWSTSPPASDGNPLYVSTTQFQIEGPTGTDSTCVWTTPAVLTTDGAAGADGADGNSVYYASIFRRSASAPATPTGGQYNFGTQTLTPPTDWSNTPPASDGNALYVCTAIAEVSGTTGIDSTLTWTAPAELTSDGADGAAGDDGADGLSVHVSNVYRRSATAPLTPTGGSYNFGTNALTPPSLWSVEPPAGSDPLYVSTASWSVQGTTGVDSSTTWSAPAELVRDGTDGIDGADAINSRYPTIYRLNSNAINSSSGTFADPLNNNASWSFSVPTMTTDGDVIYASSRILTSDGLAPQEANWSTPAVYAQRTDGVDGIAGDDGQGIRAVNIYKLNDSVITDDTQGTFANPLSGMEAGWSYNVPSITADGDEVYVSVRTFTSDGLSPQDANWSTPAIYSQRTDGIQGVPGADAVDTRYPTIYRLNSNTISSTSGTFADPLAGNAAWSYDVPALVSDGDIVYAASRIFTSDGNAPQQGSWSTPAIYAQRTDGSTGTPGTDGDDGQGVRQVNLYRLNSNTYNTTAGTYADPATAQTGWSYSVPAIVSDGDIVYVITRTFTDDTLAPQDATWSVPTVYAQRTDGIDGVAGADAVDTRYPTVYKLNDSLMTDDTAGTFADPLSGMEAGWGYSIPALASDGDIVYASSRIFTSDGLAPQQANWSTPAIYAQRTDGSDGGTGPTGDDGQATRQVNLYRLNSSAYASTAGTFADPQSGNTSWSYSVPALATDGDTVYVITRTFTDDGLSPQDAAWSAPVVYSQRTDGTDGDDGAAGADGDDGRDAVVIGGVKINYSAWATANAGEMFIHGLDATGAPADVDGSYIFNASRNTLTKGYIYTNVATNNGGFIVLETGAGTPFTGASAASKMAGCQIVVSDGTVQWQYDNNSAWTDFTETDTMIIIGHYNSGVDNILSATLTAPIPLDSAVIDAAQINAANLRAITATIGNLETRATGGSPTTPRLVLQDSQSPLQIFDDDDTTSLLALKNTVDGFRIDLLGDFVANSIDSSQMFSETGISELRGRLGLSDPSSGTGGSLSILASTVAYSGTLNVDKLILIDQLPQGGGTGDIASGGNDVTLFWKLYYSTNGFISGLPGFSAGQWTIKLQYKKNTDAWVDVPTASWTVTGNLQVWGNGTSEPYEYSYNLNEERSFVWTGALALNDYVYRIAIQCDSGSTEGKVTIGTANEPLSGAGVIEAHTHEADDIDFGVLADARIPNLATTKITSGTFADARISLSSVTQHTASLYATAGHLHSGVYEPVNAKLFRHISSGYNSADVTVSGTAPGSPAQGDIWFDTAAASSVSSLVTATGYSIIEHTGTYAGLNIAGPTKGAYRGIAINGGVTFMSTGTTYGLYDQAGPDWLLQGTVNAGLRLYYNGSIKLETLTGGVSVTGDISATTYGGVGISGGSTPPSGSQLIKSHTNGYTYLGWLNTVSGTASAAQPARIYCSQDAFLRYMTAAVFRTQMSLPSVNDTTPDVGSSYLYQWRSGASPALYVRQASTGQIAKFFKNATSGSTTPSPTTSEFTIENDGAPMKGALGIPYYVSSGYIGGKMTVASTAPSSPQQGDIWFDTS